MPDGLDIVAIPQREDPSDAFVSLKYNSIDQLPNGATVGTSSLRRKSQLLKIRPDIQIKDLRGNVDTRLRKLEEGQFDAVILASAGLKRLGLENRIKQKLTPDIMIPAVCQGFLGIEARVDDKQILSVISFLNDEESFIRASAERSFLATLEGGCQVPLGAYCEIKDGKLKITGYISDLEGREFYKDSMEEDLGTNPLKTAKYLGRKLAEKLLDAGGKKILEHIMK